MEEEVQKRIREIREGKGLNQGTIAQSLDISVTSYSKIERGDTKLTLNHVERIAKALGVSPYELIGINDKDTQSLIKENEELKRQLKDVQELFDLFKGLAKGWLGRKGERDNQRSAETILEEARKIGKEIDL